MAEELEGGACSERGEGGEPGTTDGVVCCQPLWAWHTSPLLDKTSLVKRRKREARGQQAAECLLETGGNTDSRCVLYSSLIPYRA